MRAPRYLLALIALSALALAPDAASAAVRLAAPGAAGASPCNPAPCGLATAVNGASDGDQVVLAPGTYKFAVPLNVNKAIDVGAQPGVPASIVFSGDGNGAAVENAGATLHDVRISLAEQAMAYALQLDGGTVERVFVDGSNGIACQMSDGAMRNSACLGSLQVSGFGPGSFQSTLSNVTAAPLLFGAFGGAKMTATATNTIALPRLDGGNDAGVKIDVSDGSSATVVLANSNYAAVDTSLSSGKDFTFTAPGTNGNQTAPPQLVNPAAGDFRQLASSPTIDAGLTGPPLGALDLDGAARVQARCIGGTPIPDIGAYELTPTVACPAGPALPSNNFSFGKLRRNAAKGTATLAVTLPGAGKLVLRGKGLVRRQASTTAAKTVKLVVKAKGRKAAKLRADGKVKLRPLVTFTPSGGSPLTKPRSLLLRFAG